jgi:uncharacterized metal-binding protein
MVSKKTARVTLNLGIPLLEGRVAPRCTCAEGLLLVTRTPGQEEYRREIPFPNRNRADLFQVLARYTVDTLVCGGIDADTRSWMTSMEIAVIDNVACSAEEVLDAWDRGELRSGLGFSNGSRASGKACRRLETRREEPAVGVDCLECEEMVCLQGKPCRLNPDPSAQVAGNEVRRMMESSMDVSLEESRKLCRLAELVYFCLGMGYSKIGLAYCVDLQEPARVLTKVLRRFFTVVPVCCKVGGLEEREFLEGSAYQGGVSEGGHVACNPLAQARVLNGEKTDLNVIVGLCMGADCVFAKASEAPVTTLFVKDKCLANNPIGAVYSEHYLQEIAEAAGGRSS